MSLKNYDYTEEQLEQCKFATIQTNKGDIKIELFFDETPNTVANFAHLAQDGFYDGLNFHRVIDCFMAQGGCPQKTGTGGPDWSIECECNKNTHTHQKGSLSMAHAGKNTGGSQFFICFERQPHLDGVHTVFGAINENDEKSLEVLDSIEQEDDIVKIIISKD